MSCISTIFNAGRTHLPNRMQLITFIFCVFVFLNDNIIIQCKLKWHLWQTKTRFVDKSSKGKTKKINWHFLNIFFVCLFLIFFLKGSANYGSLIYSFLKWEFVWSFKNQNNRWSKWKMTKRLAFVISKLWFKLFFRKVETSCWTRFGYITATLPSIWLICFQFWINSVSIVHMNGAYVGSSDSRHWKKAILPITEPSNSFI